ncbi:MAG: hypothetical protein JRN21_08725 [Nitrososphaerota archaeon]|nr:hypothetical protein [Nitrososphaerota archaeon]
MQWKSKGESEHHAFDNQDERESLALSPLKHEARISYAMELWKPMYLIIWVAFFQIIFILFSPLGDEVNLAVHVSTALVILGLAFEVYRGAARSSCPSRIKRITRATWYLALFQVALGIVLGVGLMLSWGGAFVGALSLMHVATALAIVTQASSSATAYDMWEEKEFQSTSASSGPA